MAPVFAMFGFGVPEMAIVGAVILLLFGNRLPGAMRSLGRSVVEFKKGVSGIEDGSDDSSQEAPKQSVTDADKK